MAKQDALGAKAYDSKASADKAATDKAAAAAASKNYYDAEPKTRPSNIPSTYSQNGHNYTVVFHDHQYGYYDGYGHFIATMMWTNAINNAAMADAQQAAAINAQTAAINAAAANGQVVMVPQSVPVQHHSPVGTVVVVILVLGGVGLGIYVISKMV